MADTKPQDPTRLRVLTGDEASFATDDPDGTPADAQIRSDDIANYIDTWRYTITATVSSNNLTVALKDIDGNTLSTTYPVNVRIGDAIHTVSSSLSVTANAATNWFDSGGSELATNSVPYFVYLGYNATDGVVIGFSRIPWAETYSDFSTTSTNEQYCKINDISNASASDDYIVIGYFEATLSAGAGYTWSSATNVISRPKYNTGWFDFTPTFSASGSMTWTSTSLTYAKYRLHGYKEIEVKIYDTGTTGGTASTKVYATLPMAAASPDSTAKVVVANVRDATTGSSVIGSCYISSSGFEIYKADASNWALGASRLVLVDGSYTY